MYRLCYSIVWYFLTLYIQTSTKYMNDTKVFWSCPEISAISDVYGTSSSVQLELGTCNFVTTVFLNKSIYHYLTYTIIYTKDFNYTYICKFVSLLYAGLNTLKARFCCEFTNPPIRLISKSLCRI